MAPLVASAACADALAALATNEVARSLVPLTAAAVAWAALAAGAGLVGLAGESAALQVGTVGRIGPPGPGRADRDPRRAGSARRRRSLGRHAARRGLIVAGLVLVVAATAGLGGSRAVGQLRHPEAT